MREGRWELQPQALATAATGAMVPRALQGLVGDLLKANRPKYWAIHSQRCLALQRIAVSYPVLVLGGSICTLSHDHVSGSEELADTPSSLVWSVV